MLWLHVVVPIAKVPAVNDAADTVNAREWGGFGPGTLTLETAILTDLPNGEVGVAAEFSVDVSGTADRLPTRPGMRDLYPTIRRRSTDFAAIFGETPSFERGSVVQE